MALASVLDDTYDSFGTFKELELFTKAIQRWDINFTDQLPEYMQLIFQTLLNAYQEFEEELGEKEKYRVHYAKEAMKKLARAYFDEARWLDQGYIPTVEEYLQVALVSGAYSMLTITSLLGMGDIVTEDIFKWASNDLKLLELHRSFVGL